MLCRYDISSCGLDHKNAVDFLILHPYHQDRLINLSFENFHNNIVILFEQFSIDVIKKDTTFYNRIGIENIYKVLHYLSKSTVFNKPNNENAFTTEELSSLLLILYIAVCLMFSQKIILQIT